MHSRLILLHSFRGRTNFAQKSHSIPNKWEKSKRALWIKNQSKQATKKKIRTKKIVWEEGEFSHSWGYSRQGRKKGKRIKEVRNIRVLCAESFVIDFPGLFAGQELGMSRSGLPLELRSLLIYGCLCFIYGMPPVSSMAFCDDLLSDANKGPYASWGCMDLFLLGIFFYHSTVRNSVSWLCTVQFNVSLILFSSKN